MGKRSFENSQVNLHRRNIERSDLKHCFFWPTFLAQQSDEPVTNMDLGDQFFEFRQATNVNAIRSLRHFVRMLWRQVQQGLACRSLASRLPSAQDSRSAAAPGDADALHRKDHRPLRGNGDERARIKKPAHQVGFLNICRFVRMLANDQMVPRRGVLFVSQVIDTQILSKNAWC